MSVIRSALRMVFPKYINRSTIIGRLGDERDYAWFVGDGSTSPLVDAVLSFIIHGFTQMYPTVAVSEPDAIDATDIQAAHPAAVLFRRPSYDPDIGRSWLTWMEMIAGVVISYRVDGNAYIQKVRSGAGRTVQLWYTPHFMMEPRWDPNDPTRFITHYDYAPSGGKLAEGPYSLATENGPIYRVGVNDVIHLRDGLDPQNPRKGFSKVKKILREIFTDEQAARWTASLLRNQGVPGVVISPADAKGWIADNNDAEEAKQRFRSQFTNDRMGEPIVMRGPTKVEQFGFSPEAMKLRDIRAIPEERISAQLGVPAAVVGFGAGLEHTKVGRTMEEFVDLAWQNGILPPARMIAPQLTEQYLSEWEPEGAGITHDFAFDTTRVPIMASYHKLQAERHEILVRSSIEDRDEARRALGLPASLRGKVYVLQSGSIEVPSDKPFVAPALPTPGSPALPPGETQPALPSGDTAPAPATTPAVVDDDADLVPLDEAIGKSRSLRDLERLERFVLATKAATPAPTELHLHIDRGAFQIDATSHVDPGAIVISPGAVQVDAPLHIDPGAVVVTHQTQIAPPAPTDVEIVRDGEQRVVGIRAK